MAKSWTFKNYLEPNGQNPVHTWLDSLPKRAKARINVTIGMLEAMDRLEMPYARALKYDCAGLIELRIPCGNVQYRPLSCYGPGPRDVTILFGAIEKGSKFVPASACSTALTRKTHITTKGRTCDHKSN